VSTSLLWQFISSQQCNSNNLLFSNPQCKNLLFQNLSNVRCLSPPWQKNYSSPLANHIKCSDYFDKFSLLTHTDEQNLYWRVMCVKIKWNILTIITFGMRVKQFGNDLASFGYWFWLFYGNCKTFGDNLKIFNNKNSFDNNLLLHWTKMFPKCIASSCRNIV
jgi:hypothetical protein